MSVLFLWAIGTTALALFTFGIWIGQVSHGLPQDPQGIVNLSISFGAFALACWIASIAYTIGRHD